MVLERAYNNIYRDLDRVAAVLAEGGLAAVGQIEVRPGNPMAACPPSDCPRPRSYWPSWAGRCTTEYKYDGVRVGTWAAGGVIELFTRRMEQVTPSSLTSSTFWMRGLAPARRS